MIETLPTPSDQDSEESVATTQDTVMDSERDLSAQPEKEDQPTGEEATFEEEAKPIGASEENQSVNSFEDEPGPEVNSSLVEEMPIAETGDDPEAVTSVEPESEEEAAVPVLEA